MDSINCNSNYIIKVDNSVENGKSIAVKFLRSDNYNYVFNMDTGLFIRWGKTEKDDPLYSPFGPEILDIEISTICPRACSHCYKSNTAQGKYMKFETFVNLFSRFPKTVTQIAFGIGSLDGNPDLYLIMNYCRKNQVIPNITINGDNLTDEHANNLASLCGAIAVSFYDKDTCFNSVSKLTRLMSREKPLRQVNIHMLLCEENYEKCMELMKQTKSDWRLKSLGSIVFLYLKPKGKRNTFHEISKEHYKDIVQYALNNKVKIGFDSCSASFFLKEVEGRQDYKELETMTESCESTLFSYYINCDCVGFPCSFAEGEKGFKGVNILKDIDFVKDVWYNEETVKFRNRNLESVDCRNCRRCTVFNLGGENEN